MTKINRKDSIPSKNQNYRLGEEVFFRQFNDVSFFIEDQDQENFYFIILKVLFPDIKLAKIFPLNGKSNVIKHSKRNLSNRKKVYIVDKDFDDLHNLLIDNENLFYLNRYSIENYLLDFDALVDYVISEKPRLNRTDVVKQVELNRWITNIRKSLNKLIYLHLITQQMCPHLRNVDLGHERFVNFDGKFFREETAQLIFYESKIQNELLKIDGRLKTSAQLRKIKNKYKINNNALCLSHFPGKYLLKMIKLFLEKKFNLGSKNFDSFCYRIAEKSTFAELDFLKRGINNYIT